MGKWETRRDGALLFLTFYYDCWDVHCLHRLHVRMQARMACMQGRSLDLIRPVSGRGFNPSSGFGETGAEVGGLFGMPKCRLGIGIGKYPVTARCRFAAAWDWAELSDDSTCVLDVSQPTMTMASSKAHCYQARRSTWTPRWGFVMSRACSGLISDVSWPA
jgi:hypothetical protein